MGFRLVTRSVFGSMTRHYRLSSHLQPIDHCHSKKVSKARAEESLVFMNDNSMFASSPDPVINSILAVDGHTRFWPRIWLDANANLLEQVWSGLAKTVIARLMYKPGQTIVSCTLSMRISSNISLSLNLPEVSAMEPVQQTTSMLSQQWSKPGSYRGRYSAQTSLGVC